MSTNVNEDLLFYYLNLTLIDEKLTKRSSYKAIMLNAININKSRFCKLYHTNTHDGNGGMSFQLLENKNSRKTYCEYCK